MTHRLLREEIIAAARRMNTSGLNQGTSGNISVRLGDRIRDGGADRFLITPSGVPYESMRDEEIVEMRLDGSVVGSGVPSSEWRIHRDLLAARRDVDVVLHAHPRFATALACLRRDIPPFHYMVAVAGGDSIRCAPYATFGTQALSDRVVEALVDRRACLLANHGIIALGNTLDQALHVALEVEALAGQYCCALQIGEPHLLDPDEMAVVLARFKTYGRRPPPCGGGLGRSCLRGGIDRGAMLSSARRAR